MSAVEQAKIDFVRMTDTSTGEVTWAATAVIQGEKATGVGATRQAAIVALFEARYGTGKVSMTDQFLASPRLNSDADMVRVGVIPRARA